MNSVIDYLNCTQLKQLLCYEAERCGMQTVACQSSLYALWLSHAACFLYWLNNWPCAQAASVCMPVCVILISFHALGKALLILRCLSSFQTHWQSGLSEMSCVACLQKGADAFYCLWSTGKQPAVCKEKKREKLSVDACDVCTVYKERGRQSKQWEGQGQREEETHSDDTFLWQICQLDLTVGDRACLALAGFTAAAMLHMPYYISHYISNTFPLFTLLSTQPQHWLS